MVDKVEIRSGTEGSFGRRYRDMGDASYAEIVADPVAGADVRKFASGLAIGTEAAVWTPAASKKFVLLAMFASTDAAANVTFRDGTAGTTIFVARLSTPGVWIPVGLIVSAAANNVLTAQGSSAVNLTATFFGREV